MRCAGKIGRNALTASATAPGAVAVLGKVDGCEVRGFAPIVGAVNMDQISVDLTALGFAVEDCKSLFLDTAAARLAAGPE